MSFLLFDKYHIQIKKAHGGDLCSTSRFNLRIMRTLKNELLIDAPINKIWESLAITGKLESFDPTVKKSIVTR